jgi:hypothetical protein
MKLHVIKVIFLHASKIHICDTRGHAFLILAIKGACQLQVYPYVATLRTSPSRPRGRQGNIGIEETTSCLTGIKLNLQFRLTVS